MNEQKICFIICYNNELYLSECIRYLNRLEIPDGFELGIGFGMLLFQSGIRNFRNEKSWIPVAL